MCTTSKRPSQHSHPGLWDSAIHTCSALIQCILHLANVYVSFLCARQWAGKVNGEKHIPAFKEFTTQSWIPQIFTELLLCELDTCWTQGIRERSRAQGPQMKVTFVFFAFGERNRKQRCVMKWQDKLLRDPGLSNRLCQGRGHMYTCGWFMLRFDRKQQNSIKQLSFNKKNKLKKMSFVTNRL